LIDSRYWIVRWMDGKIDDGMEWKYVYWIEEMMSFWMIFGWRKLDYC